MRQSRDIESLRIDCVYESKPSSRFTGFCFTFASAVTQLRLTFPFRALRRIRLCAPISGIVAGLTTATGR